MWLAAAVIAGCGGNSGGVSSRDELVRRAFTAVTAGDVDGLVRLADHDALAAKLMDCKSGGAQALAGRVRDNFRRAVDRARGLDAEVRAIRDGRTTLRHAGDAVGDCKFSRDVTTLEVDVDALVGRRGTTPRTQTIALTVVEVGGGWYLLGAPKLGNPSGDEAIAKMTEFRDAMCACTDKACADRVKADNAKWSPDTNLDAGDVKRLGEITAEYTRCATKLANTDLPQECDDYRAAIDRLVSCDKLPQASRDAIKQAYDSMSQAWSSGVSDPDLRKGMADACRTATDAVNQAASVACP